MRERLFHGIRKDNGKWVEGYYVPVGEYHYILTGKLELVSYLGFEHFLVIPETVGQYIELPDKNGKKIFEGDIVKCTATNVDCAFTAVVLFGNPNGEYNWGFQLMRISGANANTDILLWVDMEETGAFIEVIGNIYDNPELIGGKTNA